MMKFNADAIVKALKCCNVPSCRACSECPYHEMGAECRTKRNKCAIELILELVDERRRCLEALSELADNIGLLTDKEKADTVRKMKEKLENLYTDKIITDDMVVSIGVIKQNIKDIAKEMLED